ncbi:penicillin-binding protein 2B [Paenibacillus sp. UNCCL117]|uniref:penicillin-binding transpeptidase domain-containing protein n=1 Tax=unclassified Paenibacillus TaxID=185978 RepID=UPI000884847E|nr:MULTISPECIES: penicillin-binding transpeptidase domain-containing protein [unclassified Paenibacillus]SDC73963.1 penicillin-binding protein 2B [Paenibacillus sp. cl123]SFW25130.1 penicillin-binding protein 2B [Paenibacillus sp. UNCCL117]
MTKKVKLRSLLIGGAFTLLFAVLVGRLYWVQVVQGAELLEQAKARWALDKTIQPVRGAITDRNGKLLAEDAPSYTIALLPQIIRDQGLELDIVKGLAPILAPPDDAAALMAMEERIRSRLNKTREDGKTLLAQVELGNEGWKIDAETGDKVKALREELQAKLKQQQDNLKVRGSQRKMETGIELRPEIKRFYPAEKLAAHLIGYMNKENVPVMGLEQTLNDYLKGQPGALYYEKAPKGVGLPDPKNRYTPAVNGNNVTLTIDKNIQFYIESAIEKMYEKYKPKSMTAIAVDPQTMEILGMANAPTFNPNKYWETKDMRNFMNHAIASQYEPGSTFKLVTLAATVEEGLFNPEEEFQSGSIRVADRRLHDHNISGWGKIKYIEGLKRSSNVAFVKLGTEKLGNERLRQYIDKFGFGARTGIDIPGEVKGIVNMRYAPDFATATYGQGLTATLLQQTSAYAAIANGGKLMKPYLIKEIKNPDTGEIVQQTQPQVIRQVVSEKTSKQVGEYLEQVVSDQAIGTGRNAYIDGYRIAGKTGTAQKVLPGEKGYADGVWVISFIGYAPLENPRILVAIVADEPDLGGDYHRGGEVAAPAFREIVSQSLRHMGIAPTQETAAKTPSASGKTKVPDLTGISLDQAKAQMNKLGGAVEPLGKGSAVLAQNPAAGTEMGAEQRIYVLMEEASGVAVPNLNGKSFRDALEVCSLLEIRCQSNGEGYVADQTLSGEGGNRTLTLTLRPYTELTNEAVKNEDKTKDKNTEKSADKQSSSGTDAKEGAGEGGKASGSGSSTGAKESQGSR